MKPLSSIAEGIQPSATLAIDALAKKMVADGIDVISFGAGEPDFNTPDNIKLAAIKSIVDNQSHYTPATGILPLKEAICEHIAEDHHLFYKPSQINISSGAKHVLYLALCVLLNPGDEVILPAPYWVTYYEAIKMCGGVPVILETTEEQLFKVRPDQLEAAITEKTKCIIICNPSNPTGAQYSRNELEQLADVIVRNDLYVIEDLIYSSLSYLYECVSIASLNDEMFRRTLIIRGVSKAYAMTGWRIGYVAACDEISKLMANYISHSTGNPSNPAQYAALEAFRGDQLYTELMKKAFNERRKYIYKRVNSINGISCLEPYGAFYVFVNIKKLLGKSIDGEVLSNSSEFVAALLKHSLVAAVPGIAFGCEGYMRLSYATSMENIEKGLDRIANFVAKLK